MANLAKNDQNQAIDPRLDPTNHNVVAPVSGILGRIDEFNVARISSIQLDGSDFYDVKDDKGAVKKAPNAVALRKIAALGGVSITSSGPVGTPSKDYLMWRVEGSMRGPDGEVRTATGTVEWDREEIVGPILEEIADLEREYEERRKKGENTYSDVMKKLNGRIYGKKKQAGDLQKYRVGMSESKAMNRMIRLLMGTKSKYEPEEIAKPFTIVRIDRSPDLSNDNVLKLMLAEANRGAAALYGDAPAPELPAHEDSVEMPPPGFCEPEHEGEWVEDDDTPPSAPEFDDSDFLDVPEYPDHDPADYTLKTGTYKDMTLEQVEEKKPGYCKYVVGSDKAAAELKLACQQFLDSPAFPKRME